MYVGTHVPPKAEELDELMEGWLDFLNGPSLEDHPIIKACVLHFAFEAIHPFCDGNGRMGRLLMNACLSKAYGRLPYLAKISWFINLTLWRYYHALEISENYMNDCTPFVEYMMDVLTMAFDAVFVDASEIPI